MDIRVRPPMVCPVPRKPPHVAPHVVHGGPRAQRHSSTKIASARHVDLKQQQQQLEASSRIVTSTDTLHVVIMTITININLVRSSLTITIIIITIVFPPPETLEP